MSIFYCQLDYEHVPYLSPMGTAQGNISNNGCGVCSASMVIENMLGVSFPPEVAAKLAKMCGAREVFGTDLYTFAPVLAAQFNLNVIETESVEETLRFLQEKRGMVIANVRGDRPDDGYIGVFSTGGHYVVIAEAEGTTVKVLDPMYREGSGRFDIPGRKGKVRMDGTDAYADMSVFAEDCKERPFFLFEKKDTPAMVPVIGVVGDEEAMKAVEKAGCKAEKLLKEEAKGAAERLDGIVVSGASAEEAEAVKAFREKGKPSLGVCSGICAVAAANGAEILGACGANAGTVKTVRGTRLEVVMNGETTLQKRFKVEKAQLPETMRVCAVDGEEKPAAIECCTGVLCLGVSWRPEKLIGSDPTADSIFAALAASARR